MKQSEWLKFQTLFTGLKIPIILGVILEDGIVTFSNGKWEQISLLIHILQAKLNKELMGISGNVMVNMGMGLQEKKVIVLPQETKP